MIELTSVELNYMVYRYLIEEGMMHSAFVFGQETHVVEEPNPPAIESSALRKYVEKGVELEYVERHTSEKGEYSQCLTPYSISQKHVCKKCTCIVQEEVKLKSQGSGVAVCAWADNGNLATGTRKCQLSTWRPPEEMCSLSLGDTEGPHGVTAIGYEGPLLAAGTHVGDLVVLENNKVRARMHQAHRGPILTLSFNGNYLLTGGWEGKCVLWDVGGKNREESGDTILRIKSSTVSDESLAPLAVERLRTYDNHTAAVLDVVWRGPSQFATCSADHSICFVGDTSEKKKGHEGEVNAIKWKGSTLASCSDDKTVRLWREEKREAVSVLRGHELEVYTMDWQSVIATGSFDSTIMLWDPEKGSSLGVLRGHDKAIYSVCFNREGSVLASGGLDGKVILWDARNSEAIKEYNVNAGVYQVSFSKDGNSLAVCSSSPSPLVFKLKYL